MHLHTCILSYTCITTSIHTPIHSCIHTYNHIHVWIRFAYIPTCLPPCLATHLPTCLGSCFLTHIIHASSCLERPTVSENDTSEPSHFEERLQATISLHAFNPAASNTAGRSALWCSRKRQAAPYSNGQTMATCKCYFLAWAEIVCLLLQFGLYRHRDMSWATILRC